MESTVHLHYILHLVIWQTLLSKATYNWGVLQITIFSFILNIKKG